MASLYLVRTAASVLALLYTIYVLLFTPSIRTIFSSNFSPFAHPFRFLSLLTTLLLNTKTIPLAWHVRLFGMMIQQIYGPRPIPLPRDALFRPVILTGLHTSLAECDYNGHKSNSTYFADLDIARSLLISTLLRKGMREAAAYDRLNPRKLPHANGHANGNAVTIVAGGVTMNHTSASNDKRPSRAPYMMALGGVVCTFKREIKPYEPYEVWIRVLSWDRKWIYLISHIVKAGVVRPDECALQPWRQQKPRRSEKMRKDATEKEDEVRARWNKAVFATSVAKYVVKKGRLTINPEEVWMRSDLVPKRPAERQDGHANGYSKEAENEQDRAFEHWTWDNLEAERLRGLKLMEGFDQNAADAAVNEFPMPEWMMAAGTTVEDGSFVVGHDHINGAVASSTKGDGTPSGRKGKIRALGIFKDWVPCL